MKEVSEAELARIRLARARAIDEERYKDDEPAPKKEEEKPKPAAEKKEETPAPQPERAPDAAQAEPAAQESGAQAEAGEEQPPETMPWEEEKK